MSTYALWQSGPRGPTLVILHERGAPPFLSDDEKKRKIGEPMKIAPEHMALSINELAELYPAPTTEGK